MKHHDESRRSKRPATAANAIIEPRRLLAAMSVLGVSLGVSAAAPADHMAGVERGSRPDEAAVRLAETKKLNNPSSTKSMGWDVRPQSNQKKERVSQSNQWKIRSDQKKAALPAVQSDQKK
jgi:hypothetical protein